MSTTHPKLMTFLITILMPWTNLKNENDLNDDFQNGLGKRILKKKSLVIRMMVDRARKREDQCVK